MWASEWLPAGVRLCRPGVAFLLKEQREAAQPEPLFSCTPRKCPSTLLAPTRSPSWKPCPGRPERAAPRAPQRGFRLVQHSRLPTSCRLLEPVPSPEGGSRVL